MTRTALAMDDEGDDDNNVVPVEFDDEARMVRRTKVMFLRNHGKTWSVIAQVLGISEATARKDYSVVCRDLNNEQPADVVARHRAVIFDIQRANYPKMMAGNKDAALVILKALDREAKLLGLDAPTRILASVNDVEYANEAARLIDSIQQMDPDTLKELGRGQATADIIDGELVTDSSGAEAAGLVGPERGAADPDSAGAGPRGAGSSEAEVGPGEDGPAEAVPGERGPDQDAYQQPVDDLDGWSNIGD